tara:strand:- start:205 stop:450 length:246 start_codon:yes stop_codon:yes gene_type:complete
MRRSKKSKYVFDDAKFRDLLRDREINLDEIQGRMFSRGHRVDVTKYLVGASVPSSEVLIDLLEVLDINVEPVIEALFSKRK